MKYSKIITIQNNHPATFSLYKIMPNPATQVLQAIIRSEKTATLRLSVTGNTGVVLLQQIIRVQPGDNKATLDIRRLGSGIYILKVTGDTGASMARKITVINH